MRRLLNRLFLRAGGCLSCLGEFLDDLAFREEGYQKPVLNAEADRMSALMRAALRVERRSILRFDDPGVWQGDTGLTVKVTERKPLQQRYCKHCGYEQEPGVASGATCPDCTLPLSIRDFRQRQCIYCDAPLRWDEPPGNRCPKCAEMVRDLDSATKPFWPSLNE